MEDKIKTVREFDVLVTHKNCLDGKTCALIAKYAHRDCVIIFAQYGNEDSIIDSIPSGKRVLFADFTLSEEGLTKLKNTTTVVAILDHHKTAEAVLSEAKLGDTEVIFNMEKCGSILLWEYLFPNESIPLLINYVNDRDLWLWELEDSREFSEGYALRSYTDLVHNLPDILTNNNHINNMIGKGKGIIEYKNNNIDRRINDKIQTITFIANKTPHKMWCLNNRDDISETGNVLSTQASDDGEEFNSSCQYFITDDVIVFSLRSVNDKDLSVVAMAGGGGGHKAAAGFSIKVETFNKFNGFHKLLVEKVLDLDELKAYA